MLRSTRLATTLIAIVAIAIACAPKDNKSVEDGDTDADVVIPCPSSMDADGDTILDSDESATSLDFDADGTPNHEDEDSDNDTKPDSLEAGDDDCFTPPVDSDSDGAPDYLDIDSDDNCINDRNDSEGDFDGDGLLDFQDMDDDDDFIPDADEVTNCLSPDDFDGDTMPDIRDDDSDGDTIADISERTYDPDEDSIPAFHDDDSDGDGLTDAEEAGDTDVDTPPRNTDGDAQPDFLDIDSDGDGLSDAQEIEAGTDHLETDTDGDGYDDLAEWAHPDADPTDPLSGIPAEDYYVILPPHEDPEERDLDFGTDIQVADIFFLVDTTGSMYDEIDQIVDRLSSFIIPEIRTRIDSAAFGVGYFADFPQDPYGIAGDNPFEVLQIMTLDETLAQAAVESLPRMDGADHPESQVEALYQTVTGDGLGTWIPVYGCPDGVGAPCFRPGALPIILLVTDAPMHNGPPATAGTEYTDITPAPHTWEDAIDALNTAHAKVIGLDSEPTGLTYAWFDLERTAVLTETVDFAGDPLVFDIGTSGEDLDTTVVDAVEILASHVIFDVDTYVVDLPDDYTDIPEVDASCFIKYREPQEGWLPPMGYTYEEAVASIDSTTFYSVVPGTAITFLVTFHNEIDADTACYDGDAFARVFRARIVVRGDGVTDLDEREVVIIVPARPPILE